MITDIYQKKYIQYMVKKKDSSEMLLCALLFFKNNIYQQK